MLGETEKMRIGLQYFKHERIKQLNTFFFFLSFPHPLPVILLVQKTHKASGPQLWPWGATGSADFTHNPTLN